MALLAAVSLLGWLDTDGRLVMWGPKSSSILVDPLVQITSGIWEARGEVKESKELLWWGTFGWTNLSLAGVQCLKAFCVPSLGYLIWSMVHPGRLEGILDGVSFSRKIPVSRNTNKTLLCWHFMQQWAVDISFVESYDI